MECCGGRDLRFHLAFFLLLPTFFVLIVMTIIACRNGFFTILATAITFLVASVVRCDLRPFNGGIGLHDESYVKRSIADILLSRRAICPECREDAFLEDIRFCTNCDHNDAEASLQDWLWRTSSESSQNQMQHSKMASQSSQGQALSQQEDAQSRHKRSRPPDPKQLRDGNSNLQR